METEALAVVDSPLPVFSGAQMSKALQAYKALQVALDEAMPDQIMDLDGKKFRKKGYWRAVAVAFNLTVETIEEHREVSGTFKDNRPNFGYVITRKATAPNGRSVVADGTCFAVEKARRFKCPHPESEGSRRTIHFPHNTCPDFDLEFQWRALPGDATEHNVRAHASTRAFNRAVADLVGFGEVSAEEVDAHATDDTKSAGSGSTQRAPQQSQPSADGLVTIKSVKPKDGGGKDGKKPWTRYDVTLSDGRKASTFDKGLGAQAQVLEKSGLRLKLVDGEHLKRSEDGKYLDLLKLPEDVAAPPKSSEPLTREAAAAQPLPDLEPPCAEKVMTVRELKDNTGNVWLVVQGTEREYFAPTDSDAAKAIAATIRDFNGKPGTAMEAKTPLVFKYEWKPSPKGPRRVCTGLADVDTLATKAAEPHPPAAGDPPSAEQLTWS